MFRAIEEAINTGTELIGLKEFRENSKELEKMRKIAISTQSESKLKTLKDINDALTFSQLLSITEQFDFECEDNKGLQKTLRDGTNAALFCGKPFNHDANWAYQQLHFRERAIDVMAKKGFTPRI